MLIGVDTLCLRLKYQRITGTVALLYVDGTYIKGINEHRTKGPLIFWSDDNLELRHELEIKNGGFGLGDMRSEVKKIKTIFQWMMDQKKRVEKLAVKAYNSYPRNAEVEEVIQKYNECFKAGINLDEMDVEKVYDEVSTPFAKGRSRTPPVNERMMPIQTENGLMMVVYDGEPFDEEEGLTQVSCKVSDWVEQVFKSKSNLKLNNGSKLKEIPSPSFSIGLTQIENEEQKNRDDERGRAKNKRKTKLSVSQKSPFIDRVVKIGKLPSAIELKVWCYLIQDPEDQNPDESEATEEQREVQKEFRSLEPCETILNNVVDCWAIVLNNEETKRAPDSPYRLFMTTGVISNVMLTNNKLKASDRLALFMENTKSVVFVDNIDKEMLIVDIVMFPILENGHYYLVCFDLKKGTFEILDNMEKSNVGVANEKSFIKKDTVVKVKEIFLMYLYHVGHKGCQGIRLAKPVIKKLGWSTKSNVVDCGVFLMRHMETYMGSKLKKWKCGLYDDGPKQEVQINNLRLKYAYKILTSDVNIHKNRVVDVARELDVDAEFS
ncbi:hypothetical protein QVD17_08837 [Tagetes erecta]|uniref:Ubiquitin-like protease family profile domain-containing protein n=1 Tax=Tagetes erecta TaxID=13708 RepID=A0AAD8L3C7_TARER|nr:hypothetical protein QVD17_08837 [Tagetes erecta]